MAIDFGGAAAATPYGAAANALGDIVGNPTTSASGDIRSGGKTFGFGSVGGVNFGTQIPTYVWIGAAVFAAIYLFKRR